MKVIKEIEQVEELAQQKVKDLIKLFNAEQCEDWRYILDASNDDYSLLEVLETEFQQFVGYGEIMGDLKGIDIYQMYTKSIVENLNTNETYQNILQEYNDLKTEFNVQSKVISDLLIHEISTYAEYDDDNAALLQSINDNETLRNLLTHNHVLNHFVSTTFDSNYNKYGFEEDLLNHLVEEISNSQDLIELKQKLESKNEHEYQR